MLPPSKKHSLSIKIAFFDNLRRRSVCCELTHTYQPLAFYLFLNLTPPYYLYPWLYLSFFFTFILLFQTSQYVSVAAIFLFSTTRCSLNIVFFSKILKYSGLSPFSVSPCVSVCTHTRQVEPHQRCSRTGRVQKNHKILKKKHNI